MVEIQEEIETSIQEIKNQALKIKEELNFEEVKSAFSQAKTELSAEKEKPPAQWNVAIFTKYSDIFNGFRERFIKIRTEQLVPVKEKVAQISAKSFKERANISKEINEEISRKINVLTDSIDREIHSIEVFVEPKLFFIRDALRSIVDMVNVLAAGTEKRFHVIQFYTENILNTYKDFIDPLDKNKANLFVLPEFFFQKISEL